jgi:hypothetical protein
MVTVASWRDLLSEPELERDPWRPLRLGLEFLGSLVFLLVIGLTVHSWALGLLLTPVVPVTVGTVELVTAFRIARRRSER